MKKFSIFLVFMIFFSMISGVSAAEKTSDDMNDFNHYTIASKMAYAISWNLFRYSGGAIPGDMDTLSDISNYFNNQTKIDAYVVGVNASDLKVGDLVHVKNSQFTFLIYKGYNVITKDNESSNVIILESLYDRYQCDPAVFSHIFDGYAIKMPTNNLDKNFAINHRVDGSNITDTPVYDPTIASPVLTGDSVYMSFWKGNAFNPNNTDSITLKDFLDNDLFQDKLSDPSSNISDMVKAQTIFNWVQQHVGYTGSYVGSQYYPDYAITQIVDANSCDQAGLVYTLCKLTGLNAVYHKSLSQFPAGQFAHVWADVQVDGVWLSADTTSKSNMLGNTTYSNMIQDYGTYDRLDC
jgi:hypothetical protein